MSITINKILPIDLVGKKVTDKADDFDTEADVTKEWFDEYPDVITGKHNDLVDALASTARYLTVPAAIAAATANKGTYPGSLPIGEHVVIAFHAGNTAENPTITIDGDTLSITGIPTTAKHPDSAGQVYRFRRTSSTVLSFNVYPDYVCERGVTDNFRWWRMASGVCECFNTSSNSTGTLNMDPIGSYYASAEKSLALPTNLFVGNTYTALPSIFSGGYVLNISFSYSNSTRNSLKYYVLKGVGTSTAISFRVHIVGEWR